MWPTWRLWVVLLGTLVCLTSVTSRQTGDHTSTNLAVHKEFEVDVSDFDLFPKRRKRWLRRRNHKVSPIHFQQDRYLVEVKENVPVKTVIVKVSATHERNQPLYYSMLALEDSRSSELFALDTSSGEISVAKALDRETLFKHVLKITVYESLDPSISTSTTVTVNVLDVQDNHPIFEKNSYFAEVREDALVGTTVLSIFARDLDDGLNGEVEYSLADGIGSDLLKIDPKSGVIAIKHKLDREELSFIRLNVVASDKGTPILSSQALIEISVIDVNDNQPVFQENFYNFTVFENTTVPSIIGTIKAEDADAGINGKVHYSIVTTSTTDLFHLDYSTGELSIRQPPNPRHSPLSLLIRAKDGGQPSHSSTVHCQVNIMDVNDHAPTFVISETDGHIIHVEENIPAGREIGRLFAVDEDAGENGEIRFSILEDNSDGEIELDPVTGALKTTESLDRERQEKYKLKVMAQDRGSPPLNSTTEIHVIVKDLNDNAPEFDQQEYNLTLSETTPRGKKLIQLTARDADLDSKVTYKIEQMPRKLFTLIHLGNQGAILSLAQEFSPLDQKFKVVVSATDQGGLQGRCTVNVVIDDVNSPPLFIDNPVAVRIPENSPVGFHVLKMSAEDSDHDENAALTFSIDSEKFAIDFKSGLITVAQSLDREELSIYAVPIQVSDSGDPPMSSSTVLEIILDDVNDNAPTFTESKYEARIPEDIAVGTSFLQLKATDPDEGANGIVNYFMNETDVMVELDHFHLDQTSGMLRVNRPLDREKIEVYVLPVAAVDSGDPSLRTLTSVTVYLTDVNDNAPQFEKSSYDFWIAENSPIGTVIGSLRATDPDVGDTGKLEFRIFGGQDAKLFEIEADQDEPGMVRLLSRTEFDYEAKANKFTLELQAASGQLSSTVSVTVHVSDVNDNRPQLKDFMVLITTFDGDYSDIQIGSVPAFDPDHNATLEHYLEENDVIAVEEFSGKLILKATYQRQINMDQKACVSDGPNTECARCFVSYVSVNEEALRESVTLQLHDLNADRFLELAVFRRFLDSLASVSARWVPESFRVFSIVPEHDFLNVSFFVSVDDNILSLRRVEETLFENLRNFSTLFGHRADLVHDELCNDEPCPYFQKCRRSLKYVRNSKAYESENVIMRSLDTIRTFTCECPPGFTTTELLPGQCNVRLDLCYDSPCLNNGTCVSLESSYRCECAPDHTGPRCEFKISGSACTPFACRNSAECHLEQNKPVCKYCRWQRPDADENCRLRSVSFNGNGYMVLPKAPGRYDWELSVRIATIASTGIVLYAGDNRKTDYFELSVANGLPMLQMSLGGKGRVYLSMADWPENRVNDGEWHTINVKYYEQRLVLSVDECDEHLSLTMSRRIGYKHCAEQIVIQLPARCADLAVPCHRSLDLHSTMMIGNRPGSHSNGAKNTGFVGCIRDLYLDRKLIDFSFFDSYEKVGNVFAGCQKYRPDKCLFEKPCGGGAKCVDRWRGHQCRCHHRSNMKAPSCAAETSTTVSLFSDEAYVSWRLPTHSQFPMSLFFEFRTRERKTQVLAIEFEMKSQLFVYSVENGHGLARIDNEQYLMPFPLVADAEWHSVEVFFSKSGINLTTDTHYQEFFPVVADFYLSQPQQIYSGQAPSTSHPHVFLGCIRNVELNRIRLKALEASQTRPSCQVNNACASGSQQCPKKSTCVRDWDRHNCVCRHGYVGDSCLDVCSIEGVCLNEGLCIRSNSSRGYECLCPEGFRGAHCEKRTLPKTCPAGWFGTFPRCQRCSCSSRLGFKQQCDRTTGQCLCQAATFYKHGSCVACECGHGSSSPFCHPSTGQCSCTGDSSGRRCDRCRGQALVLDKKTLKCVKIKDRCASEVEGGVQWPSTLRGVVSRQSCPGGQMGIATRRCSDEAKWELLQDYNCTISQLYDLNGKTNGKFDTFEVGRQLLNMTSDFVHMKNRNIDLALNVFQGIVATEAKNGLSLSRHYSRHVRDSQFTRNIVDIGTAMMDYRLSEAQFHQLLSVLHEYGVLLTMVHEAASYLPPFQIVRQNILFAVDKLDLRKHPSNVFTMPKYDQFAPPEPDMEKAFVSTELIDSFHSHKITVNGPENFASSSLFYAIVPRGQCTGCEHSLVLLHHLTAAAVEREVESFKVTFASPPSTAWRVPECVWLDIESDFLDEHGIAEARKPGLMDKLSNVFQSDLFMSMHAGSSPLKWRNDRAMLLWLNSSHVTCEYRVVSGGIFTVLVRVDGGSLVQFSLYSNHVPLGALVAGGVAMVLSVSALFAALFRKRIRMRFMRCTVVIAFVLNATLITASQKLTFSTSFCAMRNAFVSFSVSLLFSWLFIYSFHIYHVFAEGQPGSCRIVCTVIGALLPTALASANLLTFTSCSLDSSVAGFWLIVAPMAVFLLLSFYALATSFLIALGKQYNLVASKFALKKTMAIHTLLILCCALYNGTAVYMFVVAGQSSVLELTSNVLLCVAAALLFYWVNLAGSTEACNTTPKSLWANQTFPTMDPTAAVPLLDSKQPGDRVYDGPPGEWMPDLLPSETYVHHTLQRSLQLSNPVTPVCRNLSAQVPQILSPAQKVFGTLADAGSTFSIVEKNRHTLSRESSATPTSATRKLQPLSSATISRSSSLASPSGNHNKYRTMGEQLDDAYYTYSTTRFKSDSTFR